MSIVLLTPRQYTVLLGLVRQGLVPKTWYKVLSQDSEIVEIEFEPVVSVSLAFYIGGVFRTEEIRQKTGL